MLRMEVGNVSQRQQPDLSEKNSWMPLMGIQPWGEIPHQSYVLLESDILASKSNQTSMTTVHASHDNVTAMQRNETRNLSRIFKVVPYKYYNKNEMLFFSKIS